MIKGFLFLWCLLLLSSCSSIELVLIDDKITNPYKNKTTLVFDGGTNKIANQELLSFFGTPKMAEYILITSFSEKKENRLVKKNQVAEKTDYELAIHYNFFYKDKSCEIFNKSLVTKFSFVPKSFGYNFGTDRSLEKLYESSLKKNIQNFINSAIKNKSNTCL